MSGRALPDARSPRAAGERPPARARRGGRWPEPIYRWRNRLLADPGFHRRARRNPLSRWLARRRARALFDLCTGFVHSQTLAACVELGLFEQLADAPRRLDAIARATGLRREAARTLLRAATALGLLEDRGDERYGLGIHGAALRANPGVVAMIAHHRAFYRDLADPVALLRGEATDTALARFWDYAGARVAGDEAEGPAAYSDLMGASQALVAEQLIDVLPLARHRHLLDVGGGDGSFLAAVARAAPALELSLFDLPPVAARAEARLARETPPVAARCVGGDMFADELPRGADLLSLVRVVHDHDEPEALALLARCRRALAPGGSLVLAEPMALAGRGDPASDTYFGFYLAAMGRGRPRTAAELGRLLERAGFERPRSRRTALPMLLGVLTARVPTAPRGDARRGAGRYDQND